jgi:outer membrane receptor protein involved in Fe transport
VPKQSLVTKMIRRPSVLTIPLLAIAVVSASTKADDSDIFQLPLRELLEVKVSVASLFEESQLDVASSVSVVQHDEWERRGARRVGDALESAPSVVSIPTWGGADAIAIRGYATELSVRGIANSLDGVPLNSYTYATSFYDKPVINLKLLDRIELIRGPGSTLYGSDAFHGALSYQTHTSKSDLTEFNSEVGAPSYASSSLISSLALGTGRLHAGFASQKQGRQDLEYQYTSPTDGQTYSGVRDNAYRDTSGYLTYELDDSDLGAWRFNAYASDYEAKDFPGIGMQFFPRVFAAFDIESASIPQDRDVSSQDSSFVLGQIDFSKQVTDLIEISVQAYHWQSKLEWRFDNSRYPSSVTTRSGFGPLPCLTAPSITNPNPLYCPHELQQGSEESRSGLETQIKSELPDLRTKWVAGLGFDRLKVKDSYFKRLGIDDTVYVDEENPYIGDKRDIRFAFFQSSTDLIPDTLQMVYGVRIDDYSDIESHTSPRLGAIFHINNSYTSKLLFGHAFRAPTVIEKSGNFDAIIANENIKPEEIDTYEWVNLFHYGTHQTELTFFNSHWDEGIVLAPTGGGADNQYVNTQKNESYGVEVSTLHSFSDWQLQGSGSYVRSKNERSELEYGAFPSWLFSMQADYAIPGTRVELSVHERIMMRYRQADTLGSTLAPKSKDYYRTDISVRYNLSRDASEENLLFATIQNIFDRDNTLPSLYNSEGGLSDLSRRINVGIRWSL